MQNGFRIANLRVENNISQNEMAKLLGVSLMNYRHYEQQELPIKLETLNIISNMFNVSLDYLLNLTNDFHIKKKISNEIDYKYLRFSLKYHRRMQRIKQSDLANYFQVAPQTIHNYEKFAKDMSVSYLIQFAKRFKISVDYICGKTLQKEII